MLSKKAVAEEERQRAQADTVAAAASAQEARFELARRLTEASANMHSFEDAGARVVFGRGDCAVLWGSPCACVRPSAAWRSQLLRSTFAS